MGQNIGPGDGQSQIRPPPLSLSPSHPYPPPKSITEATGSRCLYEILSQNTPYQPSCGPRTCTFYRAEPYTIPRTPAPYRTEYTFSSRKGGARKLQ